jgi:hypothetical protein
MVTKTHSRPRAHVTNLEVQWLLRKQQYVGRFDITMRHLQSLQVGKYVDHASEEAQDVLLRKVLLSGAKVSF